MNTPRSNSYSKAFEIFRPITRPESEKAPIAEFTNPAAYRLKPEGEAPRFFIPATIYGYLLKKTQSLIKRLGKMEDTIIEQTRKLSYKEEVIANFKAKIAQVSRTKEFLQDKLKERDQEIEQLKSALEFERDVIQKLETKAAEPVDILKRTPAPDYSAGQRLINAQAQRITILEAQLDAVRKAVAPPATSGYVTLGGLGQVALDSLKTRYQERNQNVGIQANPNVQIVYTPAFLTNENVVPQAAKPPVEGYARSISNSIKAGDTSRFDARSRFNDTFGRS
jgi:hypothetical protein